MELWLRAGRWWLIDGKNEGGKGSRLLIGALGTRIRPNPEEIGVETMDFHRWRETGSGTTRGRRRLRLTGRAKVAVREGAGHVGDRMGYPELGRGNGP